jgi:hypothetical protein
MKTLIALALMAIASMASAQESCTYAIKDNYGYEYETLTRYSYSRQAACSDADFACRQAIAEGQRYGRYYNAHCEEKWDRPTPPPREVMCTTDLVDWNNYVVRSFTGTGRTDYEACAQSENFCRYELQRHDTRGYRCITRGNNPGPGPGPGPRPPRTTTESCTATRFDPQGITIQNYFASHTGPVNSDVKGEACRKALYSCQSEIRGRQYCNVR